MIKKEAIDKKQNNAGFTLIEVIVAVIILAIVSIPLIRSFASAANTNGKAAIKARATSVAENLMEDIKSLDKDQILIKYHGSVITPNAPGAISGSGNVAYELKVTAQNTEFPEDLNKMIADGGYDITIKLDPSTYPNINNINFADFNTVNSDTSAVFCLTDSVDSKVYKEYQNLNSQLEDDFAKTEDFFEENLKREIRVDISKTGKTLKDKNDKEFESADVKVSVTYLLVNNDKAVPVGREQMQKISRQVYSGNISGNELQSIYILYPPRYKAAKDNGDIIIVHNHDNVEANLYVVAQNTSAHADEWKEYCKKSTAGLNLQIYEGEVEDKVNGGTKQPLTLFTNIHEDVDYQKKESSELIPITCFLNLEAKNRDPEGSKATFDKKVFNRIVAKKGKFANESASKALDARDVDGKTLDATTINDKIYEVTITIEKSVSANEWPVKVELTGSILE